MCSMISIRDSAKNSFEIDSAQDLYFLETRLVLVIFSSPFWRDDFQLQIVQNRASRLGFLSTTTAE